MTITTGDVIPAAQATTKSRNPNTSNSQIVVSGRWIFLDPDLRKSRAYRGETQCAVCGKKVKPSGARRIVKYDPDSFLALHPQHWRDAASTNLVVEPIGSDCANRLGLEWSSIGER